MQQLVCEATGGSNYREEVVKAVPVMLIEGHTVMLIEGHTIMRLQRCPCLQPESP